MQKHELVAAMKPYAQGAAVITRQELAHFLGVKNPAHADRYLAGLQRISGKYYFIPDVADRLMEHVTVNDYTICR